MRSRQVDVDDVREHAMPSSGWMSDCRRSNSACASRSVAPITVIMPGITLIESGCAHGDRALLHVGIEFARDLRSCCTVKMHFGRLGGELAAIVGLAGLHHHRLALRRALHVSGTAHLEMLAHVIEEMQLVRVEGKPGLLVGDEGVVVPAVPQAQHDLGEFARPIVAVGMRHVASRLKFNASEAADEVTRFQPARPLLIWSSDAKKRATW